MKEKVKAKFYKPLDFVKFCRKIEFQAKLAYRESMPPARINEL